MAIPNVEATTKWLKHLTSFSVILLMSVSTSMWWWALICTGREVTVFTGLVLFSLKYLTQSERNYNQTVTQDRHPISSAGGIPLSTEWVDYVEEPMKYQALRPHFFSMGGWWCAGMCGVLVRDVVGGGWRVGSDWCPLMPPMMGGTWCPPMLFLFLEKNYAFDWKDNFCS